MDVAEAPVEQPLLDDEDDLLTQRLRQQQHQQLPSKRQRCNAAGSPQVLNSDSEVNMPSVLGTSSRTSEAAGAGQVDMTVLGSKTQAIADANKRLMEKLEQAQKQLEEQENSYEPEALAASPEPAIWQLQPVDDFLDPADDVVYVDSDAVGSPAQSVMAADSLAEDSKLPLNFKTEGQEDVIVLIHPAEPLTAALNRFREYVRDQGWGEVSKFLSPDAEKLTGNDSAKELGLEAEETIEVYLS